MANILSDLHWIPCDSKYDLESRLENISKKTLLPLIETTDANAWGYLSLKDGSDLIIPVNYVNLGLSPQIAQTSETLLVGINDLLVGFDPVNATKRFQYKVPTVFHEFVRFDDDVFVVRDEIGFVGLSYEGKEKWSFCKDLIVDYKISGHVISGTTLEGHDFQFEIP